MGLGKMVSPMLLHPEEAQKEMDPGLREESCHLRDEEPATYTLGLKAMLW